MDDKLLKELGHELDADDSYFDLLEKGIYILVMDDTIDDNIIAKEDILGFVLDKDLEENDEIINPWNDAQCLIVTHIDLDNNVCYVALW